MIKRREGFTLIELLVTMVVFVMVIAAASSIFTRLLTIFKQQNKMAETNIEGIVGLDMLRRDIEHAGYGLPWAGLIAYNEVTANPFNFNDSTTTAAPRPILSADNVATYAAPNNIFNGSDYLVIKAINVARDDNSTAQKSTILTGAAIASPFNPREWSDASQNLTAAENVIVLAMGASSGTERSLVSSGANFSTQFASVTGAPWRPVDQSINHVVYGISTAGTTPRMPFNRADYFIWRDTAVPATDNVPDRCSPNTGVLRKAVVSHTAGDFTGGVLPLVDCVADMQVIYRFDMDGNGTVGTASNADGSSVSSTEGSTAAAVQATFASVALLRQRLKEVRVYILAHEGQRDPDFIFNNFTGTAGCPTSCANCVRVSDGDPALQCLGREFDLNTNIGGNWRNYRWKVYTLAVKPNNLE